MIYNPSFKVLLLIMILVKESQSEWSLEWNDEFNNHTLDTDKWEVENELISCHGNYINQINCNTNSTRNMRLIDGTLAITAIYEKRLDKEYTSGKIITKRGFTYGRFEIRAALPKGKILRPAIFMIPVISSNEWARNGQIDIMTNVQTANLGSGIHYNVPSIYNGKEFVANTNLNDFHTYSVEWSESEIKWFFDHINHLTVNISRNLGSIYTRNGDPFNNPFRLLIHLGVGGTFFPNSYLTVEDVMSWKCSLLIIDYVRIYKWVNETNIRNLTKDDISSENICSVVMPLVSPRKKLDISFTVIISIISSLLMIVLIPVVIFLFVRQKKMKRLQVERNIENYDDIYNGETYDVCYTSDSYADPYQELDQHYVGAEGKDKSSDKQDAKDNRISNPRYLSMNKMV